MEFVKLKVMVNDMFKKRTELEVCIRRLMLFHFCSELKSLSYLVSTWIFLR